jgi:isoamylase
MKDFATEASSSALGVTWVPAEEAFNFSLYSKHATAVTLLLYAPGDVLHPCRRLALDAIANKSRRVWDCRIKAREMTDATYCAYLVAEGIREEVEHLYDGGETAHRGRFVRTVHCGST